MVVLTSYDARNRRIGVLSSRTYLVLSDHQTAISSTIISDTDATIVIIPLGRGCSIMLLVGQL